MNINRGQRGQALILIVLGIVGLVSLTALAIDAGYSFSDRRNAQNAADTAAMAGALAKTQGQDVTTYALNRAASNGYTNDGVNTVTVNNPPVAGCDGTDGPYVGNTEYVQVITRSTVDTFFAPIVGINQLNNCVESIARAKPATTGEMFFGNAMVSLAPNDCSAYWVSGNGNATATGGGVFVNSDCTGGTPSSNAFRQGGSGSLTAPSITVVGGASYSHGHVSPAPTTGAEQIPYPPEVIWPNPTCSEAGSYTRVGNTATLTPGSFSSFPPVGGSVKTYILQSGIYCISGNWSAGSQDSYTGSNVLLYMINGRVTWNGGATINLDAPDSEPYAGLLIYLPLTNSSTVTINGNSNSTFTGTFLAPAAPIRILGTGAATGFRSQVIGYTIEMGGTSNLNIFYSDADNYDITIPTMVELSQ